MQQVIEDVNREPVGRVVHAGQPQPAHGHVGRMRPELDGAQVREVPDHELRTADDLVGAVDDESDVRPSVEML